ncbi:MAG: hypothetical protein JNN08_26585 [Bryobacterales bacterium]|nr:hypothetical protein [Bryobacterales bacterium]
MDKNLAAQKKQKLDKLVAKMQLAKNGSQKLQSVLTALKKAASETEQA